MPKVAYVARPNPTGWMDAWNGMGTVVTLAHDALMPGTVYTMTVTGCRGPDGEPTGEWAVRGWFVTVVPEESRSC